MNNTDQFVFVAVRLKSRRLPLKALEDIEGMPLLLRLTERIAERFPRERIVLCTSINSEDDLIEQLAAEHGINCYRGDELDVMGRFIEAAAVYKAATIARVTGDNPLTDPDMLVHMFKCHTEEGAEYTYTDDLPVGTRAEIIDVASLRRIHGQLSDPTYSEYMTYMLKRPDKLKVLEVKIQDHLLKRPELSLTVDTLADITLVREIYKHFGEILPSLQSIIEWLDSKPELRITLGESPIALPDEINCSFREDSSHS